MGVMATGLVATATAPAMAQNSPAETRRRPTTATEAANERTAPQITGEVVDQRRINLRGERDAHLLVKVRTSEDTIRIVDLGPERKLDPRMTRFERGDWIRVRGDRGRIDGRTVLIVDSEADDHQFMILRPAEMDSTHRADRDRARESSTSVRERRFASSAERASTNTRSRRGATVDDLIRDWPEMSRKAANSMRDKYGEPDEVTASMLIWHDNGPWKRTIVYNTVVNHDFPKPHQDVLEQVIDYSVPADKFDDLARFDGSVVAKRTSAELSARCHKESMNMLALNLADDIVKGERSVEEARQKYAETVLAVGNGETPELVRDLQFNRPNRDVTNSDNPAPQFRNDRDSRRESGSDMEARRDTSRMSARGDGKSAPNGDHQRETDAANPGDAGRTMLIASGFRFNPSKITVAPGELVKLRLVNQGLHAHRVKFELPRGEVKIKRELRPGEGETLTFRAPEKPGEYVFYCPHSDHRDRGMEGVLVVKEAKE